MNGRTSKLLRKVSRLTKRDDKFVKKEFKKMDSSVKKTYLSYLKINIPKLQALEKVKNGTAA